MTGIAQSPKIYHITHINNLAQILSAGVIWSDARCLELGLTCEVVGMSEIKRRRLGDLPVKCYPHTMVGEYVPFYLCPRSVMLYILYMNNHPDLTYRGGQRPLLHFEADLRQTVAWAHSVNRLWAFTSENAGTRYADFYCHLSDLGRINWQAVAATDFRDVVIKEGKQAEFLVHESFPWHLVERIGVLDQQVAQAVYDIVQHASHQMVVEVKRDWYY